MNIFDAMARGYEPAASIENTRMTTALQRELGLLAHKLGLDQLEVEKMLGLRSADTADKRADTELTLGQGQLDLGRDKLAADTRLGEGRLNLDQQLGLGKLNLDSSLGFGELGNQRYLGELGANTQNFGNILDLMGTMDQSSASRYGADQTLAGVLQRAIADQNIQRMRGETDLGVAGIQNQPALLAEQNKQGRFGAMTDFIFPMLSGVLGGLGFTVPEQQARQTPPVAAPDNSLIAERNQLQQQLETLQNELNTQNKRRAMGLDPESGGTLRVDPRNNANQPTPIAQKPAQPQPAQPAPFNPAALLGMLGQMPQPPQMQPPPSFAPAPVMPAVPPPPAQPTPTGKSILNRGPSGDTRTAIMKPPPQNRSPVYQGDPQWRRGPIVPEFQQIVPFRV